MHEETLVQEEVTLRDYLELLRRRRAVIFNTFLAALVVGAVVAFFSPKWYSSDGQLLVSSQKAVFSSGEKDDSPVGDLLNNDATRNIETRRQVLTSPPLVDKAYLVSGLQPHDKRVTVSNPPGDKDVDIIYPHVEARDPALAQKVLENWMNLFIEGDKSERRANLNAAIDYAKSQLGPTYRDWQLASLAVQQFAKKTNVMDYDDQLKKLFDGLKALEESEDGAQADIQGKQALITKAKMNLLHLPATISTTEKSTNPEVAKLQDEIGDYQAQLENLKAKVKPTHPDYIALQKQIDSLQDQLKHTPAEVPANTTVPNPEVLDTQKDLRVLEAQQKALLASAATIHAQKLQALGAVKELNGKQFPYADLIQKRDLAQKTYADLASKLDELNLKVQAIGSQTSILMHADRNNTPVRPKKALTLLLAALAGLFLGVCFALLQDFMDDRVNTVDDARRLLPSLPVLGVIPRIDSEEQRLLTSCLDTKDRESLGKRSAVLESYRKLRANVRFAAIGEPLQTIMVTSSTPGEGKSTTAVNLAVAMAKEQKRVVIVDIDLRLPTMHDKFGIHNTIGLTKLLDGTIGLEDLDNVVRKIDVEDPYAQEPFPIWVLTAGPEPPNPTEMLTSQRMQQVQETLKDRFDIVIYDSPPCVNVADSQVMATTVDGVLYVVHIGSNVERKEKKGGLLARMFHFLPTLRKPAAGNGKHSREDALSKQQLRHGYELLRRAQARILGVVLNKYEAEGRNDYYGYYGYYGGYGNYDKYGGYGGYLSRSNHTNGSNGNGRNGNGKELEELAAAKEGNPKAAIAAGETSRPDAGERASTGEDKE